MLERIRRRSLPAPAGQAHPVDFIAAMRADYLLEEAERARAPHDETSIETTIDALNGFEADELEVAVVGLHSATGDPWSDRELRVIDAIRAALETVATTRHTPILR